MSTIGVYHRSVGALDAVNPVRVAHLTRLLTGRGVGRGQTRVRNSEMRGGDPEDVAGFTVPRASPLPMTTPPTSMAVSPKVSGVILAV